MTADDAHLPPELEPEDVEATIAMLVEVVRSISDTQGLGLQIAQQLTDAMRELIASQASLGDACAALEARVDALGGRDAPSELYEAARRAQRHAREQIDRATWLEHHAAALVGESRAFLEPAPRRRFRP